MIIFFHRHHQHGRWQARIGRVAGNKDLYLGTFSKFKKIKSLFLWCLEENFHLFTRHSRGSSRSLRYCCHQVPRPQRCHQLRHEQIRRQEHYREQRAAYRKRSEETQGRNRNQRWTSRKEERRQSLVNHCFSAASAAYGDSVSVRSTARLVQARARAT